MAQSPNKVRLFIGAFPSVEIAQWMLERLEEIDLPESRLTPVEQVHLTVHFVGSVLQKEIDSVIASVEHAIKGVEPFDVEPNRLVTLPRRGPAKLVALEGTASASLLELNRRLVVRLADTSRRRSKNRFLPHFTLCRFSGPRNIPPLDLELDAPALRFSEVRLMQSKLSSRGVFYEEISGFTLG